VIKWGLGGEMAEDVRGCDRRFGEKRKSEMFKEQAKPETL
jgi:hypothetical protein